MTGPGAPRTTAAANARRAAVAALAAAVLVAVPLFGNSYHLHVACLFGIIVVSAMGLNLLTGYAGLISLGHAVFMGVGAYGVVWFSTHAGLPFLVCVPLSGLLAAGAGIVVGLPSLRIKGLYLAIATLAAQFILSFVFNAWEPVTGGRGGTSLAPGQIAGIKLSTEREMYYPIAGAAVAALLFARNLFRTRLGRALIALRDRDSAAECSASTRAATGSPRSASVRSSRAWPGASWPTSTRWSPRASSASSFRCSISRRSWSAAWELYKACCSVLFS